jgi:PAS domain S-box-containing protein
VIFLVATVATLSLWDAVFRSVPFALYFAAVAIAAWRAGWVAGLAVGVAGVLTVAAHQRFDAHLVGPALVLLGVSAIISLLVATRDRAVSTLRESERQYRLMVENVRDYAMFMTDAEGRVTRWNTGAERLLGWREEEIVGKPAAVIFTPEDRAAGADAKEMETARQHGHAADERWHQRKDGSRFFATGMMMRVNDEAGRHVGFTKVLRDVTERVRADESRRAVESRWQRLAEQSPQSIQVFAPDGTCRQVNPAWERLWGITLADVPGYNILQDPQLAASGMMPRFRRAFAGEPVTIDPVPYTLDRGQFAGRRRWVGAYVYPVKNESGRIEEVVLVHEDVTERREAEDALRESEERFAAFMNNSPTASWITDADGRFQYVSGTYVKTFALPTTDLIGKRPSDVYASEFAEQHESTIRSVAESGQVVEVEESAPRPDGSVGEFLVYKFPLRGNAGRVLVGGVAVDVTERKRAQRDRERLFAAEQAARSEAERASRMKDEFLATLSHELRTPLNAILGWSQILASGKEVSEELADGLRTIERNARAQAQIIEDLLDMSRIIGGKVRLDVQRVDLALLLHQAIETVRPSADAKGIRLTAVLDPLAGPISGDPNRLQQVFWNLLTNAIKFTPRGGQVQVLLERVNSQVEASVVDTGEGIKPEFLPLVFDRFRQADPSTTRRHGGLGLGLSIVKQLVELHGGSIRAKSAGENQGSTFTVSLPLSVIHPEPQPQPERRHPKAGGETPSLLPDRCSEVAGVRVLVVDDEPDARALVKRLLEDCHAVVFTAASAAEALKTIQAERPDVLVSDIGMPTADGYEFMRQVRALGEDRGGKIPALALTAYARSEDRMRAVQSGFQMHVPKPVEPAELITMVASLAGRS